MLAWGEAAWAVGHEWLTGDEGAEPGATNWR